MMFFGPPQRRMVSRFQDRVPFLCIRGNVVVGTHCMNDIGNTEASVSVVRTGNLGRTPRPAGIAPYFVPTEAPFGPCATSKEPPARLMAPSTPPPLSRQDSLVGFTMADLAGLRGYSKSTMDPFHNSNWNFCNILVVNITELAGWLAGWQRGYGWWRTRTQLVYMKMVKIIAKYNDREDFVFLARLLSRIAAIVKIQKPRERTLTHHRESVYGWEAPLNIRKMDP
jgi:hypothetical protein